MEQNLAEPVPISELADRLDISSRQLERLFQASLGVGPTTYYRTLRLRYARWLLTNSERTVTDIALETGFSDCAHFSRQFRAKYGESPTNLRAGRGPARPSGPTPAERAGVRLFTDA
jgi:transcriptional regulator GlxA family with amidase domain